MPLILGHRGYSAMHPENSMQAFRAALEAGMDGFELDVQTTLDGSCIVLHDHSLWRTTRHRGIVSKMRSDKLPPLRNGEPIPMLAEALTLCARLVNVELKSREGWQVALNIVERASALERVLFSSFIHPEIFELHAARSAARCGLLWTTQQANKLTAGALARLPSQFKFHVPADAVYSRPAFWAPYRDRLVLWGIISAQGALPLTPSILIADGP